MFLPLFFLKCLRPFFRPQRFFEFTSSPENGFANDSEFGGDILLSNYRKPSRLSQISDRYRGCNVGGTKLTGRYHVALIQSHRRMDDITRDATGRFEHSVAFSQHGEFLRDSAEHVRVNNRVEAARRERERTAVCRDGAGLSNIALGRAQYIHWNIGCDEPATGRRSQM